MQTKKKGKRKYYGVNLKPLLLIVAYIAVLLTASIAYRASVSDRNLFSINLLALLAGLLFESFRISDNWKTVAGIFILTLNPQINFYCPRLLADRHELHEFL